MNIVSRHSSPSHVAREWTSVQVIVFAKAMHYVGQREWVATVLWDRATSKYTLKDKAGTILLTLFQVNGDLVLRAPSDAK